MTEPTDPVAPLTERERLVAAVEQTGHERERATAAWSALGATRRDAFYEWTRAYAALRAYDRTHPEEARDV